MLRTKATLMPTTLSGAEQRPLLRSPVDRRHSIAEMAAGTNRCFGPKLLRDNANIKDKVKASYLTIGHPILTVSIERSFHAYLMQE